MRTSAPDLADMPEQTVPFSSSSTSTPRSARWKAIEQPITPPPTTTTLAPAPVMAASLSRRPPRRRHRRGRPVPVAPGAPRRTRSMGAAPAHPGRQGAAIRIKVVSDIHGAADALRAATAGADALLVCGDLVNLIDYATLQGIAADVYGPE